MKYSLFAIIPLILIFTNSFGQVKDINELDKEYLNWYNSDLETNEMAGASVDKVYELLLDGREPEKEVVVAVLDGGVDINHDDLKGMVWINEDEIPGNGIDDDNNGFIDDIHGWNFLGNAAGENVNLENMEYTRVYAQNNPDDPNFEKSKILWNTEYEGRKNEKEFLRRFRDLYYKSLQIIKDETGVEVESEEDLARVNSTNDRVQASKHWIQQTYNMGLTNEDLDKIMDQNDKFMKYYLNKTLDSRKIVGDDPDDITDTNYGNPDVIGPRPDHGTSVSGVIAAVRNNDLGINGVATNVKIMVIRIVPDGDERDKDIALGIRYAVDNGADIVNMSFGKQITTHKDWVDEAIKYADEKGVLLVHAAGNDGFNIDIEDSFPNDKFLDGTMPSNFISVGAQHAELDKNFPASFSNYGQKQVDLFAPGCDIISLDTANCYSQNDGTSVAAPVVTGVAALILVYFPGITPQEMIGLLMESSYKIKKPKMYLPGDGRKRKKAKFVSMSKSGGILNAYTAFLLASERYDDKLTLH